MTSAIRRCNLFGLALLVGGLLFARPVAAQDLIKETQDRLRIEAQRLEIIVSDALSSSQTIGKTNPQRAVEILRAAKSQVEADKEALKPERREALVRKIVLALKAEDERAGNPIVTPGTTGTIRQSPAERRNADEARQQRELAERRTGSGKSAIAAREDIKRQTNEAFNQTYYAVLKSSVPPMGDITYPKDWLERVSKRSQAIKLTELEKKIIKALNTPLPEIDLQEKTFQDVLDFIKEKTGVPLIVDQRALDDLNITYKTPVNLKVGKVSLRTVLKRLLADLGLTYVMKDEAIQITTPSRAKEMLTTRVYSVADLMPAADLRMPAVLSRIQSYQMIQMLIVMITQTVEPDSWEVNGKGGFGTIAFDMTRFALVVKQSAEMHYLMGISAGIR